MTMTDPIADMLTRIRNANTAMHDDVSMPSSNLKEALAKLLEKEGYIAGFSVSAADGKPGKTLKIDSEQLQANITQSPKTRGNSARTSSIAALPRPASNRSPSESETYM